MGYKAVYHSAKYHRFEGLPSPAISYSFVSPFHKKPTDMVHSRLFKTFFCLYLLILCIGQGWSQVRYVHSLATGTADGSSWTNAHTDLQAAIELALPGDSIFVAGGTYLPVVRINGDSLRHSTFYISKEISLFGGFSGNAGTEGGFTDRDLILYPTVLSGDLGLPGVRTDNAFHVVYLDHVPSGTVIDGVTISDGDGFGGSGFEAIGTGVYIDADAGECHPNIIRCTIKDNLTNESGGGISIQAENGGHALPVFTDCEIIGNRGSGGGGVNAYADTEGQASPTFINCVFKGNAAPTAGGGAISNICHSCLSTVKLINCAVSGNYAPSSSAITGFVTGTGILALDFINTAISGNGSGSIQLTDIGLRTSTIYIRNSILYGNGGSQAPIANGATVDAGFSVIPFGFPGENIIGLDPMFVDQPPVLDTTHTLGDMHLLPGSLALDAGQDSAVPVNITSDLDHLPRFKSSVADETGTVDIGPYEFQPQTTSSGEHIRQHEWAVMPNPASQVITIDLGETTNSGIVQLNDLEGRIVKRQNFSAEDHQIKLDISGLSEGMYFIQLQMGQASYSKKIIIALPN